MVCLAGIGLVATILLLSQERLLAVYYMVAVAGRLRDAARRRLAADGRRAPRAALS